MIECGRGWNLQLCVAGTMANGESTLPSVLGLRRIENGHDEIPRPLLFDVVTTLRTKLEPFSMSKILRSKAPPSF